jgi:predicted permease
MRRATVERDVEEEMRLDLELRQLVNAGPSPAEARDEARRRFGAMVRLREDSMDPRGWRWWDNLTQDLRGAARNLRRHRGFAASAIAILAIGIAASTGFFAILDAMVLHPFPYAGADRLAGVQLLPPSGPVRRASVTADEFRTLRQASTVDDAYSREGFTKTLGGSVFPESVLTESYTGNALALLGVQPVIGRVFTEADAPIGPDPGRVAVLTYGFWQRRFAGQPNAIGQTLQLNGEPFTVIGVVSAEYSPGTDVILPLPMNGDHGATWPALVRVRTGTSIAVAEAELQTLFEQFAQSREHAFPRNFRVRLRLLVDEERGASYVPVLTTLFAAAALLLLVGCANVTILLLARGRNRMNEIAVRHALGATRSRIVRLLLGEALLLTFAATVAAVLVARYLLPSLLELMPVVIAQRAGRSGIGLTAIVFAASLAAVATMIAGVWPAVVVSRWGGDAVRRASAARGSSVGRVGSGVLIAAQVAIVVVLLAGTGVAMRALVNLYRAPTGYDPARVTIAQIHLPTNRYTTWPERVAFYERLRAEVSRETVVERSSISLIPAGPPPLSGMSAQIDAPGLRDAHREVLTLSVASDYFATLKMPLARGRVWSASDDARAEGVTVINETMARQLWPNEDPIGKRVRDRLFAERQNPPWVLNAPGRDGRFEVIGVVRDAPNRGMHEPIAPAMYVPYTAALSDVVVLLVRTRGNPRAAERELRTAVSRADASQPIMRFIAPEVFMGWPQAEFVTAVLLGFGGVALLLASFGLFSVACYSIAHRTREFGIRITLGAGPRAVLRSAMQPLAVAVAAGLVIGLALSVALESVLARWSIPSPKDPLVLSGVVATLLLSALAATLIPARRAISIEPAVALRTD